MYNNNNNNIFNVCYYDDYYYSLYYFINNNGLIFKINKFILISVYLTFNISLLISHLHLFCLKKYIFIHEIILIMIKKV